MTAMQSLTQKAIYLKSGRIEAMGETDKLVRKYIADEEKRSGR